MRRMITLLAAALAAASGCMAQTNSNKEEVDTVVVIESTRLTARQAFEDVDVPALDLLTPVMRGDLLAYHDAGASREVVNALGGMSSLEQPLTDSYLSCIITPVSKATVKVLPCGKEDVAMLIYTIAGEGQAADSQLMFFDPEMKELRQEKYIKLASIDDFIETPRDRDGAMLKKELLGLIPFPTVEYVASPDNDGLTARLTVADYMGAEDLHRLKPYLRPEVKYSWNGKKFDRMK